MLRIGRSGKGYVSYLYWMRLISSKVVQICTGFRATCFHMYGSWLQACKAKRVMHLLIGEFLDLRRHALARTSRDAM